MYMSKQGTEMNNKVNAMMEHTWDGMYGDLFRMSRFPIIVEGSRRSRYDLTFTGTPPKKWYSLLVDWVGRWDSLSGLHIQALCPDRSSRMAKLSIWTNGIKALECSACTARLSRASAERTGISEFRTFLSSSSLPTALFKSSQETLFKLL